jgi:uncharacterized phage protein (TIGR01671 family)
MRELKFRSWDTIDKRWLFDYEFKGGYSIFGEVVMFGTLKNYSIEKLLYNTETTQYTGLKDYNGKEIYEGDILSSISSEIFNYEVKFEEGEFCLFSKYGRWGSISRMKPTCDDLKIQINVIGNIYENKSLIK